MKSALAALAFLAMTTGALARAPTYQGQAVAVQQPHPVTLGKCHHYQRYCGSWLLKHDGYTKSDLEDAIKQEGGGDDAQKDPENALFECTTVTGKIDMLEWCFNGCVETGAAGHNDACANY
ncbi:hypothetical protein MMC12_003405 [Toensbergia leucococca]|nr:hypothetical protein [Toensbergia leucococca]